MPFGMKVSLPSSDKVNQRALLWPAPTQKDVGRVDTYFMLYGLL